MNFVQRKVNEKFFKGIGEFELESEIKTQQMVFRFTIKNKRKLSRGWGLVKTIKKEKKTYGKFTSTVSRKKEIKRGGGGSRGIKVYN